MTSASAPAPTPAGGWKRDFLRTSPGIGLATVAVTLPLMFLVPVHLTWVVAFAALCLYPVLDAPRNAARPSWWLGAILSTVVWFFVLSVLTRTADARAHLRESVMVFLLPAMMFPPVLLVSGLVRLYRRARGLPREPGVRQATLLGATVCGLMIGVPTALNVIPALVARFTGNTPPNTIFAGARSEVEQADTGQVTVKDVGFGPRTFQIMPETRFGFLGSGQHPDDSKAGLDWLKPGQSVSVDYVFREHVAQARRVTIWVDRTGCAGDAAWTAMPAAADGSFLTGTTWEGWRGTPQPEPVGDQPIQLELLAGGRIAYTAGGTSTRYTNGAWKKKGPTVLIEMNDCYAKYEARLDGDQMTGEFSNEHGFRQPWTAHRVGGAGAGSPSPPSTVP